jgi:hypothetical protein
MLVFGVWLVLSPIWMAGYDSTSSVAAWNSYISGGLVAAFAIAALARPRRWEEWLQLLLGIWLVVAPPVLGYYITENAAAWNQIVLGMLITADAVWLLAAYRAKRVGA